MSEPETFDCWAVVEVMGHQRYAGHVTEQAVGGCAFVRVDVPAVGDRLAFTKLLGQASIFAITPCSEEVARAAAADCYGKPIEIYSPTISRQLGFEGNDDEEFSQ
jgi:hypothetical protein